MKDGRRGLRIVGGRRKIRREKIPRMEKGVLSRD